MTSNVDLQALLASDPWNCRICSGATINDLDLLALRDGLQRMGLFLPEIGVEPYLSADSQLTAFADRIEVNSPGGLPSGVDPEAFRTGHARAKWRNQALAWFFSRLQFAQAEGQGIGTILRVMREEGYPAPTISSNEHQVSLVLPAHPRHVAMTRRISEALQKYDSST